MCYWGCRHSRQNEICPVIDRHKSVTLISSERKKTKKKQQPQEPKIRDWLLLFIYTHRQEHHWHLIKDPPTHPKTKTKDSECIFDGPKKKARTYYFTMDPFVLLQTTFV